MVMSEVETYYINSNDNSRLVRYDVIKIDDDSFVVKVFDNEYLGKSYLALCMK